MFCPNCGTQNDDSAAACQKCAFNLKGAAAPKFKGTMLMVNAPPTAPRPASVAGTVSAKPPAPGVAAPAPAPVAAPAAPAPRPAGAKPMMKATMIGVAPPSPGGVAPPTPGAVAPPTPGAVAVPAAAPAAAAQAQPTSPAFAISPPTPEPPQITGPAYGEAVNPLGGTMVATPGAMGFGGPAPQFGSAPVAPAPIAHTPAAQMAGQQAPLGTTTPSGYSPAELNAPAGGGWGPPPGVQTPAAADAAWGMGGPPAPSPGVGPGVPGPGVPGPGVPGQSQAWGGAYAAQPNSPYGQAPQAMQPMIGAPASPPTAAGYGAPMPIGAHGPIGKMRNPVMVVVLTYVTCGLYGLLAILSMLGELKAFRQKNDINPILFLLPVIGLLEMIKLPAKVLDAKRMAGVPNAQEPNVILYLFLGIYMLPADLNEIWQVASARQGYAALPPG